MKTGLTCILVALAACSSPASETSAAPEEGPTRAPAVTKAAEPPVPVATKAVLTLAPIGLLVGDKLIPFGIPRDSACS